MDRKILVIKKTNQKYFYTESQNARIEKNWLKINKKRKNLFNGVLLNLVEIKIGKKISTFKVDDCLSYKDIVGLRYLDGVKNNKVSKNLQKIKAVSCTIIVETSDKKSFFMERDAGDWEKSLDYPGGFIQQKHIINKKLLLDDFVVSRLYSDLGIKKTEIKNIQFLKINEDKKILEYMFVYKVFLKISFEKLKQRVNVRLYEIPEKYSKQRHTNFFRIPLHPPLKKVL